MSSASYLLYSGFLSPLDLMRIKNDFDGDGKADLAVFNKASGSWRVWLSASGYAIAAADGWGLGEFAPAAADCDGDLCADAMVNREAIGGWIAWLSSEGYARYEASGWGGPGYVFVPAR